MSVRYLSVCSGIEAATVAWHPLGWTPAAFSEIEPAPRAVLAHHWPEVPLHGDFTTIREGEYGSIDILVGGTPCQSFSVAGLRGGLADGRGNLALEYLRLADRLRPRWLVWENVPGVLSSNGGRDFGSILGGMVELGYGFAYRVLDAQYVRVDGLERAVPQRRRRVFVVGYLRDWRRAAAVLFERASLRGDPAPRRGEGEGTACGSLTGTSPGGGWRVGADEAGAGQLIARSLNAHPSRSDGESETFIACLNGHSEYGAVLPTIRAKGGDAAGGSEALIAFQQQGTNVGDTGSISGTLTKGNGNESGGVPCIAFSCKDHGADAGEIAPTLRSMAHDGSHANGGGQVAVVQGVADSLTRSWERSKSAKAGNQVGIINPVIFPAAVRRLTPTECERLQGFPDGHTAIPWRGGIMPDGPRYKMLGNSMAVNVMRWIGQQIELVEQIP